jgi:hypothetical protein
LSPLECGSKEVNDQEIADHRFVIRLVKATLLGEVGVGFFTLTSADKEEKPTPHLSVWATGCTTARQAEDQSTADHPHTHYSELSVSDIKALSASLLPKGLPNLTVVWRWLGKDFPGASGHAGIKYLMRPSGADGSHYKALRQELAQLAGKRLFHIPP